DRQSSYPGGVGRPAWQSATHPGGVPFRARFRVGHQTAPSSFHFRSVLYHQGGEQRLRARPLQRPFVRRKAPRRDLGGNTRGHRHGFPPLVAASRFYGSRSQPNQLRHEARARLLTMPNDMPDTALHPILVVDDEEVVLVSLRDLLRREGYSVTTAPNAVEALARLKEQAYSVVITDHQMPMLTGLEFLGQVKQMQPDATRILITAVLNLATVIDAINKGEIYRFIVKPWLREELIVTVKNAVQRYELICKNQMLQVTTLAMNERLVKLNHDLAEQVACAEDQNAELERLNLALDENLEHSVELCLRTMQTFYPTLGNQARRVYELCRALSDGLQLPVEQRRTL